MEITARTLSGIKVFQSLSLESRASLAHRLRTCSYHQGEQIVSHKDASRHVFFIISGKVRTTIFSVSGKEVAFQDLGSGEMFGELAAIDGEPRVTNVIALSDTLLAYMTEKDFWKALHDFPEVAAETLKRLASLVRLHCERIYEFSTLGVKNRIHSELLRLARDHMDRKNTAVLPQAPTHAEIASRVTTHREAVTRELKHLESIGLIDWRPGKHVINDIKELERMVKEVRGD